MTLPVVRFFHADGIIEPALLETLSVYTWPFFALKAFMVSLGKWRRSSLDTIIQGKTNIDSNNENKTGIARWGEYGVQAELFDGANKCGTAHRLNTLTRTHVSEA